MKIPNRPRYPIKPDCDDDINLTAGIGLGIRTANGVIDVEYTQINPDTDYITVGYIFNF